MLPLLLALAILVTIFHFYISPEWIKNEHESFLMQQQATLTALEQKLVRDIIGNDYASIYATLDNQLHTTDKTWLSLTLHLANGDRIYPITDSESFDISTMSIDNISHTLNLAGRELATINLTTDWSLLKESITNRLQELEIFLIMVFGLAFITSLLLQNLLIIKPLKKLEYAAKRLAMGDFKLELSPLYNDEIGQLIMSFNSMRKNLQYSQLELHQAALNAQKSASDLQIKQEALVQEHNKTNLVLKQLAKKNSDLEQARKELELSHDQALQAEKLASVGQLAAGIAHEINTPIQFVGDNTRFLQDVFLDLLTLIGTYEELRESISEDNPAYVMAEKCRLLNTKLDLSYISEEAPVAISQSLEGIDRVTKIVRSMKDFSHPGSEHKEVIDINNAIDSTITVSKNEWKYDAELVTDFDSSLTAVPCFAGEFNQVILNIIVNAAHAIKDKRCNAGDLGTIKITTRRVDNYAEIRINDSGKGIPEDIQKRIFEPFFTTKAVGKGSGQGLAIAYTVIVGKHNGEINVESETGSGTTFIIKLPLIETDISQLSTETPTNNQEPGNEKNSVCG